MWIVRFLIASVFASIFAIVAAQAAPQRVALPGYDGVTLQGWLYTPETAGRHPAVVALHGCAGLNDKSGAPSARHADWGERLSMSGFIVLFPDSFGSRGLGSQCKESEREVLPSRERVADANAALRFLAARDDVDATSISAISVWGDASD